MKEKKLVRVKTYAQQNGITSTWVYKLIKQGKLNCIIHDGIKFIQL